ncbi:glutaredoxin-1 [Molossus molossus]|nr:glutaredoxin-1 [Molossus molossus]
MSKLSLDLRKQERPSKYMVEQIGKQSPLLTLAELQPPKFLPRRQPVSMEFVNSNIQPGKVVVFIKPTCPYCRQTKDFLSQLSFKPGALIFVDITATGDTERIQDYLQQITGARTVPRVFIGQECIGGYTDLMNMHQRGELLMRLRQIGAL